MMYGIETTANALQDGRWREKWSMKANNGHLEGEQAYCIDSAVC